MRFPQLIVFVFALHSGITAFSQGVPNSFDTTVLNEALSKAKHDTVRLEILMRLGEAYRIENPQKGRRCYNRVLSESPDVGFEDFKAKAYTMISVLKQYEAQYDSSLYFSSKAREEAYKTTDTNLIARCFQNEGALLGYLGSPTEGAELLLRSIDISRKSSDTIQLIQGVLLLSNLKASNNQHEEAIRLINQEQPTWSSAPAELKAQFQYLKGNSLVVQKEYDAALKEYRGVKPVFGEQPDPYNYLQLLDNMAITFLELGYLDSAMQLNIEAELLQKQIGDLRGWGNRLLTRARIFKAQNKLDSASVYAAKAEAVLKEQLEPTSYLFAISFWAELEANRKNWKLSKELTDKVLIVKDSIANQARVKSFDSLMLVHEVAEKEAALLASEQENEIQALNLQRTWLSIGVFVVILLAIVAVIVNRKQQEVKRLAQKRVQDEKELNLAREELRVKLKEISLMHENVSDLEARIKTLKTQNKPIEEKLQSVDIFNILKRNIKEDADWKLFEEYFENANPQILAPLRRKHPRLTAHDLRLIALLRLNLNPTEIAVLFNITADSVRKSRNRLTKKIGLSSERELFMYIMEDHT